MLSAKGVLIVLALVAIPLAAQGTTYQVPGHADLIQDAINMCIPGDVVLVHPETYAHYSNGEDYPIIMADGVTLVSSGGPDVTILDAAMLAKVFIIEGVTCTIEGFTITSGFATGLPPADMGAGIQARWSDLTVLNCYFINNDADYEGGGMWCDEMVSLVVDGCEFRYNDSFSGGGFVASQFWDAPCFVSNSYFADNTVEDHGAGIAFYDVSPWVEFCTFAGGMAGFDGGGVAILGVSQGYFVNCTFADNWSASPGSALSLWAPADIDHCILAFNTGGQAVQGGASWINCTDIFGNPSGDWTANIVTWLPMNSNFSLDPAFCGAETPHNPYLLNGQLSPCTPLNSPCGDLIGANGVGCDPAPVEQTTWGAVKALYR